MNQITLTEQGKEILTATNIDGVSQYWVGYFGLAYVPITNTANPELDPSDANYDPGLKSLSTLIGPNEKGDYIYNIWQGDLTGTGYASEDNEFTKVTLYDSNLSSNFRYHYNESTGQNNLIAWVTDADTSSAVSGLTVESYSRVGYKVYEGCGVSGRNSVSDTNTPEYTDSNIPVPAPLVYLGGELNYSHGDLSIMGHELGADWPLTSGGYPKVTPDMRCYSGKSSTASLTDDDVLSSAAALSMAGSDRLIDDYSCFVSLSNFNKAHAQVSSEGYETDYQESCHNMSRVTKLFPIAKYEIASADAETKETRTGNANTIKYTLELDFAGVNQEYRDVLTFSDKTPSEDPLFGENPKNSFKFNRIGIYAAPVTVRKFRKEGSPECNSCQVEVEPDENPVLVAIISIDDVILSESDGVGFTSWKQDFILNLEHVEPDVTTAMVRDVEIFYNITENEAITWYQNQLLASAGLSEAVTNLGIDVAYLKNIAGTPGSDCSTAKESNDSDKYADKYHTHDYLKNLVDANQEGAVRGITSDTGTNYGRCSFTMGDNSLTTGNYSLAVGTNMSTAGTHNLALGQSATTSGNFSINVGVSVSNAGSYSLNIGDGASNEGLYAINIGNNASNSNMYAINVSSGSNTGYASINMGGGSLLSPEGRGSAFSIKLSPGFNVGYSLNSMMLVSSYETASEVNTSILLGNIITSDDTRIDNSVIISKYGVIKTELTNTAFLGTSINPGQSFILRNVVVVGDNTFTNNDNRAEPPVNIDRVSVFGFESNLLASSLLVEDAFSTNKYSDAHIYMPSTYNIPEWYGIFPYPLLPRIYQDGTQSQYIPIDENKFTGTGNTYVTSESYDTWANGKTAVEVREMINKPNVPMIYTGGIALAGKPIPANESKDSYARDDYAARIKLGSGVLPSSYLLAHPVSNWGQDMLFPVSITGITQCPYAGLVMGISGVQELDGTMHIALYRHTRIPDHTSNDENKVLIAAPNNTLQWEYGALTRTFTYGLISDPGDFPVEGGHRYSCDSSYCTLTMDNISDGEEFIIDVTDEYGTLIHYPSIDQNAGNWPSASDALGPTQTITRGCWLMRSASYIMYDVSTDGYHSIRGFIATPIGTWLDSRVDELNGRVSALE